MRRRTMDMNKREIMWKKHKRELVGCVVAAIGIVILLLIMVCIFEYLGIHVPGSREMWIGLIGAVIGGAFTLFGVLITIFRQEELENEQKRLENMPILGFETGIGDENFDSILTYTKDGMITSGFPDFESKRVSCIKIRVVNNLSAFNFTIEGCAINGREIPLTSAFNPAKKRITVGDFETFLFDYAEDLKQNIFCIIRFSYEDVFGNKYYQDLPFTYVETNVSSSDRRTGYKVGQIIEIRDIKQPLLVMSNTKTLGESAKGYIDYETFATILH